MPGDAVLAKLRERIARRLAPADHTHALSSPTRPDVAAWAILALWRVPEMQELLGRLDVQLQEAQLLDGRVPIDRRFPQAAWPTPLALLAWLQQMDSQDQASRAVEFLLRWRGHSYVNKTPEVLGHDTSLVGWSWVTGSHSWIEPTSITLLALYAAGHEDSERCVEGRRMILNRQLPHGGWNFGNTTVYGHELRPMFHSTGMALSALAGRIPESTVAKSLDHLESKLGHVRSPLSLGWGVIGLTAWRRQPKHSVRWVEECLSREKDFGHYDLFLLCLLHCALMPPSENPLLSSIHS